jgi:hypothetical protein
VLGAIKELEALGLELLELRDAPDRDLAAGSMSAADPTCSRRGLILAIVGASRARRADSGIACTLVNAGRQVGGSVGAALLTTLATSEAARFVRAQVTGPAVLRCAPGSPRPSRGGSSVVTRG